MENQAFKNTEVAVQEESKIPNKEIEANLPSEPSSRKNMKEEKARKKDDKSVEQVLKALNSLETTEEKLAAMCKKYADIVDENRKLQLSVKQAEKRMVVLQREKEQLQTEHSKAVLTRSRLESLCRELQRQNKAVKDESLLKIREEEEKRKEVSAKFQSTLADVTTLMQQNNEKNSKLREDNLEMTKKFKSVCEQYELREQQVEKISKQMQLETQLADAKLAKSKMEMAAEKELLLREKQQILLEVTEYQAKIQELQNTEVNLRGQISLYTNKYDEFQNALSRSNDVFEGFKGEMEKMSKKIYKLEKETSSWKQRWEKSHQALLEMAADKQQRDSELALASRQLSQLQKLCRTLQAERTSLLAQVKGSGKSGAPSLPVGGESIAENRLQTSDGELLNLEKGHEVIGDEQGDPAFQTTIVNNSKNECSVCPSLPPDTVTEVKTLESTEQNSSPVVDAAIIPATEHPSESSSDVTTISNTPPLMESQGEQPILEVSISVSKPSAPQDQECQMGVNIIPSAEFVAPSSVEENHTKCITSETQPEIPLSSASGEEIVTTATPKSESNPVTEGSTSSNYSTASHQIIKNTAEKSVEIPKNEVSIPSSVLCEAKENVPLTLVAAAAAVPQNNSLADGDSVLLNELPVGSASNCPQPSTAVEVVPESKEDISVIKAVPSHAINEPKNDAVLPAVMKPVLETKKSKDGAKKRKK